MYDENNDLDMFNVFFNEPVLCPVGVGAGYLSIRLMQVLKPVQSPPSGLTSEHHLQIGSRSPGKRGSSRIAFSFDRWSIDDRDARPTIEFIARTY